jgi:hypothetical protein
MFGRAKLDLLSQRFLQPPCDPMPGLEPVRVATPSGSSTSFESRWASCEPAELDIVRVTE